MATTKFRGSINATEGFRSNGVRLPSNGLGQTVSVTAATLTATEADHGGKIVALNRAAGVTVTLPAATGSGSYFRFYVGTAVTSNADIIKVANASDTFVGRATTALAAGGAPFEESVGGADDTLSMNGTTTGGLIGSWVEVTDLAANVWFINALMAGSGTLASSLSATV